MKLSDFKWSLRAGATYSCNLFIRYGNGGTDRDADWLGVHWCGNQLSPDDIVLAFKIRSVAVVCCELDRV